MSEAIRSVAADQPEHGLRRRALTRWTGVWLEGLDLRKVAWKGAGLLASPNEEKAHCHDRAVRRGPDSSGGSPGSYGPRCPEPTPDYFAGVSESDALVRVRESHRGPRESGIRKAFARAISCNRPSDDRARLQTIAPVRLARRAIAAAAGYVRKGRRSLIFQNERPDPAATRRRQMPRSPRLRSRDAGRQR